MFETLRWLSLGFALLGGAAPVSAGDSLVVAGIDYRDAIAPWLEYRRAQGRTIQVVAPPGDARSLRQLVRTAAHDGELRYLVLVGDAPPRVQAIGAILPPALVPIGYVPAVVNVAWGALPHIATDNLLADLDGNLTPELSVGRIPCHSPEELKAYLDRVIARERAAQAPANGLTLVASPGRFSPFLDALIELTAQQALKQLVPAECPLCALHASRNSPHHPETPFRLAVSNGLRQNSLAWVYMGHGRDQELDRLWDEPDAPSILDCDDLEDAVDGPGPLVAAMVACRTGSLDEASDCLAERLVMCPGGPLTVIASSRVCMPYGNSVVGAELLHCLFHHPGCVGDFFAEAKRRALQEDSGLPLRAALRQIGLGVSPNPASLDIEVAEHVQMYNLLGDPLVRVR